VNDRQLAAQLAGHCRAGLLQGFRRSRDPANERPFREILKGSNVLLACPTASGKTEAVFAPLISRVLSQGVFLREREGSECWPSLQLALW
jgi:Lhr-like helicase